MIYRHKLDSNWFDFDNFFSDTKDRIYLSPAPNLVIPIPNLKSNPSHNSHL